MTVAVYNHNLGQPNQIKINLKQFNQTNNGGGTTPGNLVQDFCSVFLINQKFSSPHRAIGGHMDKFKLTLFSMGGRAIYAPPPQTEFIFDQGRQSQLF